VIIPFAREGIIRVAKSAKRIIQNKKIDLILTVQVDFLFGGWGD
jgi:hypothetical protein